MRKGGRRPGSESSSRGLLRGLFSFFIRQAELLNIIQRLDASPTSDILQLCGFHHSPVDPVVVNFNYTINVQYSHQAGFEEIVQCDHHRRADVSYLFPSSVCVPPCFCWLVAGFVV